MKRLSDRLLTWRGLAKNSRLFVLCLLLFCVSAFFSFWVFFPADILQQRIVKEVSRESGIRMRGEQASMLVPLGLKLNLMVYPGNPGIADLQIENLQLTPAWTTLLSPNQAADLKGSLAGGQLIVRAWRNGNLTFRFQNVGLLELQRADLAYRADGLLSAQFQGEQLANEGSRGQGTFHFDVQNLQLLGLEQIGLPTDFPLGLLQVSGRFSETRVSIEQVVATGGALELSGGGTLLLGATPEQTRLNLNLRLHPTQQTPDSVRDLLSLTGARPTADGSYTLQIGGSLARPTIR